MISKGKRDSAKNLVVQIALSNYIDPDFEDSRRDVYPEAYMLFDLWRERNEKSGGGRMRNIFTPLATILDTIRWMNRVFHSRRNFFKVKA